MKVLVWVIIIVVVIIAVSEMIIKAIFGVKGTSVDVDGEVKDLSAKVYE